MLFRRVLFGVLLVASAAITAEFTLPPASAETSEPTCYDCKSSDCPPEEPVIPLRGITYVIRCQNHDTDPQAHCCTTARNKFQTQAGGYCYDYGCKTGISNGSLCTLTPPN